MTPRHYLIVLKVRNRPDRWSDGWLTACPPNALAQKEYINWGRAPYYPPASAPRVKTFIHDHYASMDPCEHPSHFLLHEQFIPHGKGPEPYQHLIPQFSVSPSRVHYDIAPANPLNWIDEIYPPEDDPDWEERWDARLQWRGSNTSIYYSDCVRWDLSHRSRLMIWAGDGRAEGEPTMRRNVTVLMPVDPDHKVGRPVQVRKEPWMPAMLDIALSGEPVSCDPNVCAELQNIFEYRKRHDGMTAGKYKYYIEVSVPRQASFMMNTYECFFRQVDGNGWSSRFKRLMISKGLVFKTTMYSEWCVALLTRLALFPIGPSGSWTASRLGFIMP